MSWRKIPLVAAVFAGSFGASAATFPFNEKIEDFIANGNFPAGRVYFANLNAACPPRDENGNDNGNLADALHPSWIGHDKMSDCWLAKIKEVMK